MSANYKEIVEKVNETLGKNDTEGFLSVCTEDVTWIMIGDQEIAGADAIRKFLAPMEGGEPPKFSVERIIAGENGAACHGDMNMKGPDGQVQYYSYCDVYTFSGDKVSELRSYVVSKKKGE